METLTSRTNGIAEPLRSRVGVRLVVVGIVLVWQAAFWIGPSDVWRREMINGSFRVVILVGALAIVLLAHGLVRDRGARGFEHRVRAQTNAAQAEFHSRIELDEKDVVLGPRGTLQVLRILQEALANAVRHARPSCIELSARLGAGGQVEIALKDKGPGIPQGASEGRGLANMRARAASIGARFHISSEEAGTTVQLVLDASSAERKVA